MIIDFKKLQKRLGSLVKGIEDPREAVAFADAGESVPSKDQVAFSPVATKAHKLLVMGRESDFSRSVIDYAVYMAQRMSFDILSLKTAPLPCNTYKALSADQNKLFRQFKQESSEKAREFRQAAEGVGVAFHHVVKFQGPEDAMAEVQREHPDVEFIISDTPFEMERERVASEVRPQNQVYVSVMI